jgi:hypothetical protein
MVTGSTTTGIPDTLPLSDLGSGTLAEPTDLQQDKVLTFDMK